MAKIFISYDRASKIFVERLVQDLKDDGQETWLDQHLTGGHKWWDDILSEIRNCEIFVAALTPDFLQSRACRRETKYAKDLQRILVPVRLSDKVSPASLPLHLRELQWVDYCRFDKESFKSLLLTIRHLPKAPPLPDPLPDPPPVPISYLPLRHQGAVRRAAFDPTGERVVTASDDKTARIWDARTGESIGKPLQHRGMVIRAVFDRTGERVITASRDHSARIWDARTGEPIGKPLQHQDVVWSATFDPKGERVVTASFDDTACIWDACTGKLIGKPLQHRGMVWSAVFDPTGERVVTASDDETVRTWFGGVQVATASATCIWEARTGKLIGKPLRHEGRVRSAAFDPKSEHVVIASDDNTARIWDARTGESIGKPMRHRPGNLWNLLKSVYRDSDMVSAKFDPTGERVVTTALLDNTACIWDARTGKLIGKPLRHQRSLLRALSDTFWRSEHEPPSHGVNSAAFDQTGERVITASSDHTARIWDICTGEPIGKPLQHQDVVWSASFDPKGERVVTASVDKTARIWDVRASD